MENAIKETAISNAASALAGNHIIRRAGQGEAQRARQAYADAINKLLYLSSIGCGGSRAAAAVLLSAYNIYAYKVDIGDLCLLDNNYYDAAMQVLYLRCQLNTEPHTLITDGDALFIQLTKDWPELRRDCN